MTVCTLTGLTALLKPRKTTEGTENSTPGDGHWAGASAHPGEGLSSPTQNADVHTLSYINNSFTNDILFYECVRVVH